jgi:hypothetical protein
MRCAFDGCKKKLSNVEKTIKCVCNNTYCSKHRMPETHKCCYDYTKDKVVVVGCQHEKLIKI